MIHLDDVNCLAEDMENLGEKLLPRDSVEQGLDMNSYL